MVRRIKISNGVRKWDVAQKWPSLLAQNLRSTESQLLSLCNQSFLTSCNKESLIFIRGWTLMTEDYSWNPHRNRHFVLCTAEVRFLEHPWMEYVRAPYWAAVRRTGEYQVGGRCARDNPPSPQWISNQYLHTVYFLWRSQLISIGIHICIGYLS